MPAEVGSHAPQEERATNIQGEIVVARNVLETNLGLREGDPLITLVDKDPSKTQKRLLKVIQGVSQRSGVDLHPVSVSPKGHFSEAKQDMEANRDSYVIDFSSAYGEEIYKMAKKYGNRIIFPLGAGAELFSPTGPMAEDIRTLQERLNRLEATLKDAVGMHITTPYGTDMSLPLRHLERRWFKETCTDIPAGAYVNWPFGEIFTTPDERNVNGKLVLLSRDNADGEHSQAKAPIHVNVRDGVITSIQGEEDARILRKDMAKSAKQDAKDHNNPFDVYRIAEIGIGANSKAKADASATIEAEKALGTVHLAFGDSQHELEGVEGFKAAASHLDFIIPNAGLSVEVFNHPDDFAQGRNGWNLFTAGGLNL
ncbi:MAG TPA: aminopeptidase [Patescibacteria group bacterium]|nr:aminopeptidase [Patescibacteria group bacterium]